MYMPPQGCPLRPRVSPRASIGSPSSLITAQGHRGLPTSQKMTFVFLFFSISVVLRMFSGKREISSPHAVLQDAGDFSVSLDARWM